MPNSGRMIAGAADNHDVRYMNGALFLNDPPLDVLGWVCAGVALHKTDPLYDDAILAAKNAKDPTYLTDVFARDHFHLIVFS